MARPVIAAVCAWLWRHRAILAVTFAALLVRLVWNLWIHRPTDYAFSDMGGYLERASEIIDAGKKPPANVVPRSAIDGLYRRVFDAVGGRPSAYLALFPYGTHAFISVVKRLFGRDNAAAIGAAFAVVGAVAVGFTYATARRFMTGRWGPRLVAMLFVFYYPWISIGGYALSELPFMLCVSAAAFFGLRLADHGRRADAWLLGLSVGLGTIVRPQMLVAVVFFCLFWLLRRRAWKSFTRALVPRAALPLALVLGISTVRLHYHTGHWGLVSTNGPLNFVFGRCHNTSLHSKTKRGGGFFGPPALGALLAYEKEHENPLVTLDPAMGTSLRFEGEMWDAEPPRRLAAECVKKTGWLRQAKYAVTHVVLLWGYNTIWPDMGNRDRRYREAMAFSCAAHTVVLLPGAAIAMLLAFTRRRARSMLLALHVWSVVVTSMIYFGDTRYRAPYDGLIAILAIAAYPIVLRTLRRGWDQAAQRKFWMAQ